MFWLVLCDFQMNLTDIIKCMMWSEAKGPRHHTHGAPGHLHTNGALRTPPCMRGPQTPSHKHGAPGHLHADGAPRTPPCMWSPRTPSHRHGAPGYLHVCRAPGLHRLSEEKCWNLLSPACMVIPHRLFLIESHWLCAKGIAQETNWYFDLQNLKCDRLHFAWPCAPIWL